MAILAYLTEYRHVIQYVGRCSLLKHFRCVDLELVPANYKPIQGDTWETATRESIIDTMVRDLTCHLHI